MSLEPIEMPTSKKRIALPMQGVGYRCGACKDTGAVLALYKAQPGAYAFACNCQVGRARRLAYPAWESAGKEFEVLR
jgi:hypothetical protein